MPAAARHPHLDQPSTQDIRNTIAGHAPAIVDLTIAMYALVLDTVPGIETSMDLVDGMIVCGARQYGHDGWGMVVVSAHAKFANLTFTRGASLADPTGLFEGAGKRLRHVKLRTVEDLERHRGAIVTLLKATAGE